MQRAFQISSWAERDALAKQSFLLKAQDFQAGSDTWTPEYAHDILSNVKLFESAPIPSASLADSGLTNKPHDVLRAHSISRDPSLDFTSEELSFVSCLLAYDVADLDSGTQTFLHCFLDADVNTHIQALASDDPDGWLQAEAIEIPADIHPSRLMSAYSLKTHSDCSFQKKVRADVTGAFTLSELLPAAPEESTQLLRSPAPDLTISDTGSPCKICLPPVGWKLPDGMCFENVMALYGLHESASAWFMPFLQFYLDYGFAAISDNKCFL